MRLILASSSPRRQELLRRLARDFEIVKPQIDESRHNSEAPLDYVCRLSREKAAAVSECLPDCDALILAADTIVIDPTGDLLGKPRDHAEARRMLRKLRAQRHNVVTAFTLLQLGGGAGALTRFASTAVTMRDYSDAEIEAYIQSGDAFDKAGAYAIQNETFCPVAGIDGSYSNVVGLPLALVREALEEIGFRLAIDLSL